MNLATTLYPQLHLMWRQQHGQHDMNSLQQQQLLEHNGTDPDSSTGPS